MSADHLTGDDPSVTAPPIAVTLDRVGRVLRYAASDQGLNLWRLAFLERTCLPVLRAHADADPAIAAAADALEGLDALAWTERLPPIEKALEFRAHEHILANAKDTRIGDGRHG